jgi:hypothetical protein
MECSSPCVEGVEKIWVWYMDLVGVDAYNWTVALKHTLEFKCECLALTTENVEIELISYGCCTEFGTGKHCQRISC